VGETVNDAFLIERHRLSRTDLESMIGMDGYSDDAIRAVLDEHGTGGLHQWLYIDVAQRATAEGRRPRLANQILGPDGRAAVLGVSVSGKMLREWGMKAAGP
jgi:hypothetical protein